MIYLQGGEKLQDAYYIFQELSDKYGPTATLLNGLSACLICTERIEEAEPLLHEALEKDPNNANTLINLIVISQLLNKPEEVIIFILLTFNQFKSN